MAVNEVVFGKYGSVIENICYIIEKETDEESVYGIMLRNLSNESCIPAIFNDRVDAEKFANLLIKNDVSPLHLFEIADDYVGSII